jgi:hypothetical protein
LTFPKIGLMGPVFLSQKCPFFGPSGLFFSWSVRPQNDTHSLSLPFYCLHLQWFLLAPKYATQ